MYVGQCGEPAESPTQTAFYQIISVAVFGGSRDGLSEGAVSSPPTSLMSRREAMVRRVRGEKWSVIMILMPASEKVSWWG